MINIKTLKSLATIINIKALAVEAGLKPNTLHTKIIRGTELSVVESEKIMELLLKHGIELKE